MVLLGEFCSKEEGFEEGKEKGRWWFYDSLGVNDNVKKLRLNKELGDERGSVPQTEERGSVVTLLTFTVDIKTNSFRYDRSRIN